ncbi:hydroxylysine kinase [Neodiprion virginianus]|uniref:hydroxylysine kinase n=1 Tax=Neodiprion virginianus TaxID=2961670 RepID=UPI001EE73FC9|nr:hydroxylysine kinase [Neodiprion virginianus]
MSALSGDEILQPGQLIRPKADSKTAADLVHRLYGLNVKLVSELNAYDDKNFHVLCEEEFENPGITDVERDGYVLKITNSLDSRKTGFVEGQTAMLDFLEENGIRAPKPVKNLENRYYSLELLGDGAEKHVVRLLTYIPGDILHRRADPPDELLADVGRFAAELDEALKKFHHPAYEQHRTLWMLNSVPRLRDFVHAVDDARRRRVVNEVVAKFEEEVTGGMEMLEKGIIHGDLNEQNILVDDEGKRVVAVIDIGDSQRSCLIFEIAIALCHMLLQADDISRGKHVLRGYQTVRRIPEIERNVLKTCVCGRLCQSLVLGAYSYMNDPGNEYLLSTQKRGWSLLEELWELSNDALLKLWE